MIARLVLRHLALHPIRSLVFVGGYAVGVAVMLALLSIGEVMVEQSRDEVWVGGGDVTLVPAGVDLETLRSGGAVFLGIEQARFIARAVLLGPRLADDIEAVAPWLEDRAVYLRPGSGGEVVPLRATGVIPSAAAALGAAPHLTAGLWSDSELDRRWLRPTPHELYSEIDHFHLPPEAVRGDSTWAEWHYFNLLWPDADRWLYLSYVVGGDVGGGRWGGIVMARYRTPDGRHHSFADTLGADQIRFSTSSPDVRLGPHTVRLLDAPLRYELRARLPSLEGGPALDVAVDVDPERHRYFPPVQLAVSDTFVSGYVVPALRAAATGRICRASDCVSAEGSIAYHDHNWGTWGGVVWDWGVAHAGDLDVLYGGVRGPAAVEARRRGFHFLGYIVDASGVLAIFEPRELRYSDERPFRFEGDSVLVPATLRWSGIQGSDTIAAEIALERAALSRLSLGGDSDVYFAQMQGTIAVTGVLAAARIDARGPGFFETYLR